MCLCVYCLFVCLCACFVFAVMYFEDEGLVLGLAVGLHLRQLGHQLVDLLDRLHLLLGAELDEAVKLGDLGVVLLDHPLGLLDDAGGVLELRLALVALVDVRLALVLQLLETYANADADADTNTNTMN